MNVIEFQDVVKVLGGRTVLDGLRFAVRKGETFVLMGPSGTGKSTALLHIVGIYRPEAGRVLVMGQDLAKLAPLEMEPVRRKIGFVFQGAALLNWLDVFDNVALPLREARNLPEAEVGPRVREALELVRLWADRSKYPSELSGGMRKRVGLARAIVTRPEIVLYDEPTAGLDPAMSTQIERIMSDLKESMGVTSVLVTHDTRCAEAVGDRIAILAEGRVRAEGAPSLLASSDPWVLQFLGKAASTGAPR